MPTIHATQGHKQRLHSELDIAERLKHYGCAIGCRRATRRPDFHTTMLTFAPAIQSQPGVCHYDPHPLHHHRCSLIAEFACCRCGVLSYLLFLQIARGSHNVHKFAGGAPPHKSRRVSAHQFRRQHHFRQQELASDRDHSYALVGCMWVCFK